MYPSALNLKNYYSSKTGRVVRRILRLRIRKLWPECKGLRVMGVGYAAPYLRSDQTKEAERIFSVMPARQGAHAWPLKKKNLTCLAEGHNLPFEKNSIDRALVIHQLEFSLDVHQDLRDLWRVLKPEGRGIIIVPNRGGVWARAENSPFGYGAPFTFLQIEQYLNAAGFEIEKNEKSLFFPPTSKHSILKATRILEPLGRIILPLLGGVHILSVRKEIIAEIRPGSGLRARSGLHSIGGMPVPQAMKNGAARHSYERD